MKVGSREIEITHPDKTLFPHAWFAKGDLVDYYRSVAETMLPHLSGRAVSLQRFPRGIGERGFFQKDAPEHFPDWLPRAELPKEDGTVDYVMVEDAAALVYLANQNAITLHGSLSRVATPDRPDRLIFDLDPSDDSFARVQEAARILREALEALELTGFVQTTGSRGLHVAVALDAGTGFDTVRGFAHDLAGRLADRHPSLLTVEQRKAKRGDRVFLDYLRNAYGQTAVAPYSVRAKPGAPVATPLDWTEALSPGMSAQRHTIATIPRRLAQKPDPWCSIDRHASSADKAIARLRRLG